MESQASAAAEEEGGGAPKQEEGKIPKAVIYYSHFLIVIFHLFCPPLRFPYLCQMPKEGRNG